MLQSKEPAQMTHNTADKEFKENVIDLIIYQQDLIESIIYNRDQEAKYYLKKTDSYRDKKGLPAKARVIFSAFRETCENIFSKDKAPIDLKPVKEKINQTFEKIGFNKTQTDSERYNASCNVFLRVNDNYKKDDALFNENHIMAFGANLDFFDKPYQKNKEEYSDLKNFVAFRKEAIVQKHRDFFRIDKNFKSIIRQYRTDSRSIIVPNNPQLN